MANNKPDDDDMVAVMLPREVAERQLTCETACDDCLLAWAKYWAQYWAKRGLSERGDG